MRVPKGMDFAETAERKTILPGEFAASDGDIVFHTILGSCVSVCMYDPVNKISGMNHFLLSSGISKDRNQFGRSEGGRFGIHAMELLINAMMQLGAKRNHFVAKAFGGSSLMIGEEEQFYQVGRNNVEFVKRFLSVEKIPLVSSDLGGEKARIIYFSSKDYSVMCKKIDVGRNTIDVTTREKEYYKKTGSSQKGKGIELWDS